jgi:hypothetical protein
VRALACSSTVGAGDQPVELDDLTGAWRDAMVA